MFSQGTIFMMCCLVRRMRKEPSRRPPHSRPRPGPSGHGDLQHSSLSTSMPDPQASSSTEFSSTSTASIASVRDVLPDPFTLFSFQEICVATDNFSPSKQIGHAVWKGALRDLPAVAISRKYGCAKNMKSILRRLHTLHHFNIVKLLGACREGEHIYLIYEFIESSNLRDCLRSKHSVSYSALSSWQSRLQIALDVAKGLEYLHHMISPTLIHKYIDSRNILVSNDLHAKVAHVGVSVLIGEVDFNSEKLVECDITPESSRAVEQHMSRPKLMRSRSVKINGIQGYMPPEYINSGEVTPKYDVFAYGVILCELLSGREAIVSQPRQAGKKRALPEMLHSLMTGDDARSKLRMWMDPLLKDSYPLDDAFKVASLANSCVDLDPQKRPTISNVGWNLQKLLDSAQKWEAAMGVCQEMLTVSLQPR